jgi:hypothetical protein
VFAQVHKEKFEAAMVYLTENFVDISKLDWKITEKTIKWYQMIKGLVKANVPSTFTTTNRPSSPNAPTSVWSKVSTHISSETDQTIAMLKADLYNMSQQCNTLEKEKVQLTQEIIKFSGYKANFIKHKEEQDSKEKASQQLQKECKEAIINKQAKQNAEIQEKLDLFHATITSLTQERNFLYNAMQSGPAAVNQVQQNALYQNAAQQEAWDTR